MLFTPAHIKKINAQKHSIVIWSEAKQYWHTFAPIIQYFHTHNIAYLYCASDKEDEGLQHTKNNIYIGKKRKCFQFLNTIHAHIILCTTPNLGDLSFKRSRFVTHYIHVTHAPTDMHTYRRVAFECFDTILCAGKHQINTLKATEKIRGTEHKNLLKTGLLYYDMMQKYPYKKPSTDTYTILIAPTWGQNNILQHGETFLPQLLQNNHTIIIRPHPQSLISEPQLIKRLQKKFPDTAITWDFSSNGHIAMQHSDIMISYMSGIVFDYAFLYQKPIIQIKTPVDYTDMDGQDIPHTAWEITMIDTIATSIAVKDVHTINTSITKAIKHHTPYKNPEKHIYNFQQAGAIAGKQILDILKKIKNG